MPARCAPKRCRSFYWSRPSRKPIRPTHCCLWRTANTLPARRCVRIGLASDGTEAFGLGRRQARALADRAQRLAAILDRRYPVLADLRGRVRWPAWLSLMLLVGAFASGIVLSTLENTRRINILAFPFLGVIAWNLVIYLVLALAWLRRVAGLTGAAVKPTTGRGLSAIVTRIVVRPLRRFGPQDRRGPRDPRPRCGGLRRRMEPASGADHRGPIPTPAAPGIGRGRAGLDHGPVLPRHRLSLRGRLGKHVSRAVAGARRARRPVRAGGALVGNRTTRIDGGRGCAALGCDRRGWGRRALDPPHRRHARDLRGHSAARNRGVRPG